MLPKFLRNDKKIPPTTNHSERFHGILNNKVHAQAPLHKRIGEITQICGQERKGIRVKLRIRFQQRYMAFRGYVFI